MTPPAASPSGPESRDGQKVLVLVTYLWDIVFPDSPVASPKDEAQRLPFSQVDQIVF